MSALVLDTHAALWWCFFPEKLSRAATHAMRDAEDLVFPAIVFWETALLIRRGRLELPVNAATWIRGLKTTARAKIAPLTAELAVQADQLRMHDDPADRFIVATALGRGLPLVTKDAAIRAVKLVPTVW